MTVYVNAPSNCDLCGGDFEGVMFDAKTKFGPWGNLCTECFMVHGVGLGTGKGQKYDRKLVNDNGATVERWVLVAGLT